MTTTGIGRWLGLFLIVVAGCASAGPAEAAEIKVLSAGAVRSIVTELAEAFRKETGQTVTLTFGTVGVVRQKLAAGEPADVVIMTDVAIDQMAEQGLVPPGGPSMFTPTSIRSGS
jgi:molybdate transport system substrate-binding protein